MEVINDDYADFVSLSTQLVNVDGAVARMHRPLDELKVQLALWHHLYVSTAKAGPEEFQCRNPIIARTHAGGGSKVGGKGNRMFSVPTLKLSMPPT